MCSFFGGGGRGGFAIYKGNYGARVYSLFLEVGEYILDILFRVDDIYFCTVPTDIQWTNRQ